MSPSDIRINRIWTAKEFSEAGVVAARAFHNDPFFEFLAPRPLQRARGLSVFWRSQISTLGDRGAVYGARQPDGRLVGVAAWVKPGGYPLPVPAQLRQGVGALWALYQRPRALADGSKYLLAIDKAHIKVPHWYLELLVVDPSVQRSGIGGRLQETEMRTADEEGLPCYLETQNEDNLPYYRRFGYEVVEELTPVRNGPSLWTMSRSPQEIG
ncbi:MAG TPA: GNAT family N-acetyltransferase [Acidimicrobiales bacterium]|nr:GNAT family N-acetyltransferase [Acidimicrobiales bacterium]